MTTYRLIDESGETRFVGTLVPDPNSIYTLTKAVCTFDEVAVAGTYTATVPVLPGGRILEVVAFVLAGPWNADTAVLNAGDTAQPSGYIDSGQARASLVGSALVIPYDATQVTQGGGPFHSWLDGGISSPHSAYADAASFYSVTSTGYLPGVPYPAGDDIVVTVVTTGAYDTGAIASSNLDGGGTLNAVGDAVTVDAGNGDATGTVDAVSGTFPITGVNQGTQTFTIAGNHAALFSNGDTIRVAGSTANDAFYTVDTATFGGGSTTVTTVEAINDPTVDGVLIPATGGVVTAYTLTMPGSGYSVANGVSATAGGNGFTINITAVTPILGRLVVDVIGFGVTPETFAAVKT